MTTRFCGRCGQPTVPGAAFCGGCGSRVAEPAPPADDTLPSLPAPPPTPSPAPPPTPSAPPARRRVASLVLVLALVLLVAGVTTTALVLTRGDDTAAADQDREQRGQRTGDLDVLPVAIDNGISLLDEPTSEWTFLAEDYLPGSYVSSMHISFIDTDYPQVYAFGDVVVAHLVDTVAGADHLVGLDAATGDVRWDVDEGFGDECRPVLDDTRLLCATRRPRQLVLLDPSDGTEVARTSSAADLTWADVVSTHDRIFGFAADGPIAYAADLSPVWQTPVEGWADYAVEDGVDLELDTDRLRVSYGEAQWLFDTDTGALVASAGPERLTANLTMDGHVVDVGESGEDVTVSTTDGLVLLAAHGYPWGDRDGRLGVGAAVFDLATGEEVWRRDDLGDTGFLEWSEDGRFAVALDDDVTTLLDPRTGDTVATFAGQGVTSRSAMTDDAVITTTDEPVQVTVSSLGDGEVAWSRDYSDIAGPDVGYGGEHLTAVADRALAVAGASGVRGYADFPPSEGADDDGDSSYVTACGSPPEFVPVESEAAYGGVTITFEVQATCPGGQWLNLSQLRVPLVVDGDGVSADSGYVYADGYFDFAEAPYWIPDEGVGLQLTYPYDQLQVPEEEIQGAIDGSSGEVVFVPCEPGPDNVEGQVPSDPSYGADPTRPHPADGAPDSDATDEDRDETALEALRRIAAEDSAGVAALDWTAQLSSKKPGTYDDGMVYDSYDDILALHLQLRGRYPDSLLLFSTDWPGTYAGRSRGYWVTVSGTSEQTTEPVLAWCRDEGRGPGDCWAVRPSTTGKPEQHVDHAPADARNN